jgi:HK97 family phage major capsid protein
MPTVDEHFGKLEGELKSFIGRNSKANAEQDLRLIAIEQRLTAPTGLGGSDTIHSDSNSGPAPKDLATGIPILGKSHRLVDNLPESKRGLDAGKFLKGFITGSWEGAPEERKRFNEASGAAGGYALPLEIAAQFIDYARNASACVRAGASTVPMTGSALRIPVLTQDMTATWKQELADIQDAGGLLEKFDAAPKTLVGTALISVELFEDAQGLFNFLQAAFGRSMGQQLDYAALRGAETYGPVGLLTNTAVPKTAAAASAITYDEISLAIQAIRDRNYEPNSYVISPGGAGELNRTKASTAGTYLDPPRDVAALSQLRTVSADNDVYVGQWEHLWIMPRTGITMEMSREGDGTAWKKLGVSLRMYLRADAAAVCPNAFEIITNFGS